MPTLLELLLAEKMWKLVYRAFEESRGVKICNVKKPVKFGNFIANVEIYMVLPNGKISPKMTNLTNFYNIFVQHFHFANFYNIFVQFGGHLFYQVIGIQMGTNCAQLLADLFLYSYENEFEP